jgi:hypothetical protein
MRAEAAAQAAAGRRWGRGAGRLQPEGERGGGCRRRREEGGARGEPLVSSGEGAASARTNALEWHGKGRGVRVAAARPTGEWSLQYVQPLQRCKVAFVFRWLRRRRAGRRAMALGAVRGPTRPARCRPHSAEDLVAVRSRRAGVAAAGSYSLTERRSKRWSGDGAAVINSEAGPAGVAAALGAGGVVAGRLDEEGGLGLRRAVVPDSRGALAADGGGLHGN